MQRIRLLAALTVLAASFAVLALCGGQPVTRAGSDDAAISEKAPAKSPYDLAVLARYRRQQQALTAAVQAYFDKAIASGEIVGAGVSIVQGDSILLSAGYGSRNRLADDRVDGQTIFRLGSLSKGFTGILAAGLVAEGKLDWTDRVVDYLPDFRLGNATNTEQITLAHLLSHSSGAPYHSFTNLIEGGMPLPEIAGHFREVSPVSAPGSMYSYQNALFALSGEMMRAVTGQDIDQMLEDRFFKPLGMATAVTDFESLAQAENVALPHVKWRKGWKPKKLNHSYYNAVAAGGINASSMDMARWMRFLLGHNPEIMSKTALSRAFEPAIQIKGRAKYYHRWRGHVASYYGFGWRIHHFVENDSGGEKTMWHHGGSVNNFRNEIALFPDADLGICVLLNSQASLAKRVIPDLYDMVRSAYQQADAHLALNSVSEPERSE